METQEKTCHYCGEIVTDPMQIRVSEAAAERSIVKNARPAYFCGDECILAKYPEPGYVK